MTQLAHGELFAGISGAGLGFARAGIETKWHVEIDEKCQRVLSKHYPDDLILGDVQTVNGADLPPVDIISFGSPCQDLSVAGKREGFAEGTRSSLFFEATRIITEMREATGGRFPKLAVWENVPGAKSSAEGRDFGAALDALAGSGAVDLGWRIIDAQHWTPQRRRRVFVVAVYPPTADGSPGIGGASEILSLFEGGPRNTTKGRKKGQGAARSTEGGAGGSIDARNSRDGGDLSGTLQSKNNGGQSLNYTNPIYVPDQAGTIGAGTSRASSPGGGGLRVDIDGMTYIPEQSPAVTSKWAKQAGGPAGDEVQNLVAWDPRNVTSKANQSKVEPDRPSPTLHEEAMAIAFMENDRQVYAQDIPNALSTGGGKPGQGYPAIAFQERGRDGGRNLESQEDLAYSLNNPGAGGRAHERNIAYAIQDAAGPSTKDQNGLGVSSEDGPMYTLDGKSQHGVATVEATYFETRVARNGSGQPSDVAAALRSENATGDAKPMVAMQQQPHRWMVRRLTPTECLRLQTFPDDWLDGVGLSDSDKYRMCGNAIAACVPEWLGGRIIEFMERRSAERSA